MDMKNQLKVIIEEIKKERDREILEMIDKEIDACKFMLTMSDMENSNFYWIGRKEQTEVIKDFILNGRVDEN